MAEIVNLRTVRKRKVKADKDAKAAQNRTKFGQTKAARTLKDAQEAQDAARLDDHKRTD